MAEKVNKSYTSYHYHSIINMCVFYLSCHLAQRRAENIAVYDFITQYAIYFMG